MSIIEKVKTYISKFTDKPIYLKEGTSVDDVNDTSTSVPSNRYKLRNDLGKFKIVNIVKKPSGVSYVISTEDESESFTVSKTLFVKLFVRDI